jgi:hypothetical protein
MSKIKMSKAKNVEKKIKKTILKVRVMATVSEGDGEGESEGEGEGESFVCICSKKKLCLPNKKIIQC